MKSIKHLLSTLILIALATGYLACKKDKKDDPQPEPTAQEKALTMLTQNGGNWSPSSVVVGTTDVTAEYFEGFTITFNADKTLSTTGTTPVWERQDTWNFKGESTNVITRGSDGKDVTIDELSDTKLVLSLEWDQTTTAPGRSKSIEGRHVFTFNK